MKNSIIILLILFVHQNKLLGQNELTGKIEFYKSFESEWAELESSSDRQIVLLNSRRHRIKITQGESTIQTQTDSTGIFSFKANSIDSVTISVNEKSKVINGVFKLHPLSAEDTILLKISDKKLSLYKDSIQSPKFYTKYSEKQAKLDYKNGNARILGSGTFMTREIARRRKKLANQYNFKYQYIFGCMSLHSERRIAFRYNEVMKKLIGIKYVW
ncbi:hypothetical protein [Croceivirga thetidis]|uniref:FecR protein domain-containing protein n=1 Tax=Croceivirga thetidis TaxID=2721623 RepID=A0ABX1GX17_9FLAO|nr:hypothetical protein [Croceivirga thetidis]NKI33475.1 hypothetical protein [Croceivirga thetidis]